jgi:hypothetical protein
MFLSFLGRQCSQQIVFFAMTGLSCNTPVDVTAIAAENKFGTELGSIKVKPVQTEPKCMDGQMDIMHTYRNATLMGNGKQNSIFYYPISKNQIQHR